LIDLTRLLGFTCPACRAPLRVEQAVKVARVVDPKWYGLSHVHVTRCPTCQTRLRFRGIVAVVGVSAFVFFALALTPIWHPLPQHIYKFTAVVPFLLAAILTKCFVRPVRATDSASEPALELLERAPEDERIKTLRAAVQRNSRSGFLVLAVGAIAAFLADGFMRWLIGQTALCAFGIVVLVQAVRLCLRHGLAFGPVNGTYDRRQHPRAYWASMAFMCMLMGGLIACLGWLLPRLVEARL
jgi:hypothetical protein